MINDIANSKTAIFRLPKQALCGNGLLFYLSYKHLLKLLLFPRLTIWIVQENLITPEQVHFVVLISLKVIKTTGFWKVFVRYLHPSNDLAFYCTIDFCLVVVGQRLRLRCRHSICVIRPRMCRMLKSKHYALSLGISRIWQRQG